MISEQNSIFSGFVETRLKYYINVLFLIILKGNYFPSNLGTLLYVTDTSTKLGYLVSNFQVYSRKLFLYSQSISISHIFQATIRNSVFMQNSL